MNHEDVSQAFRNLGYHVEDTSRIGNGFPDIIAIGMDFYGFAFVEIKNGAEKLTEKERDFMYRMPQGRYFVCRTALDALKVHEQLQRMA